MVFLGLVGSSGRGVTREQRLSEEFHVKRAHGAICLRRIPKGYRGVGQWEQPDDIAAEPPTEGQLDLHPPDDYVRRRFPANQRGSNAIWLTWEAARKVYNYEVRR